MDGISGPEQKGDPIDQKLEELKSLHEQQDAPAPIDIDALPQAVPVDGVSSPSPPADIVDPEHRGLQRPIGITLIVLSLIVAGLFAFVHFGQKPSSSAQLDASSKYATQASPAPALTAKLSSISESNTLTVNGQLSVTGSLILSPAVQPTNAVTGQMYYDSGKNLLGYYNGSNFVYLQGGGNVTNTTINNITNPAVTNVTNVTGGGFTGSGTAGQLAMFTGPSALGDSMINQTGTTLNTGSGVETVNLGSQAGTSDTTLQGGTGGVSINTGTSGSTTGAITISSGPSAASTGGITIQSGDSSTTAAGNIDIDTGASVLNGTVISDEGFEDGTDNVCQNIFGDNSSSAQSAAEAHSGTFSLALTVGSNAFPRWGVGDGCSTPPFIIPVTGGHTYAFEAWVRAGTTSSLITASAVWSNDGYGGGGMISQVDIGTVTDISTGWRKVDGILTAPVGSAEAGVEFESFNATTVGEVHYFDDITVTDLSSSSATAAINLGATNAQEITIGNSGMLAATSIYGGGINLNGGTGILSLSSGTITAASGGATYTTTSGALNITSATTALWKVAGSGGTGNDLNIQAGDAGGNANGGNLYLQGGASAGTGTGGSVIVKPQNDSSQAFQVQNAAGNTALAVDSSHGILTLNTASSCNYAAYGTYVQSLTPASDWSLEDTGATAADLSGNNNTGTLSNVTTNITPGPFTCDNTHPAMSFSAAGPSQITTPNTAPAPANYSEVVMFKASSNNGMLVAYTDGGGNNDRILSVGPDGKLYSQFWNTSLGWQAINSPNRVDDGNWHIAATTESSTNGLSLYLDGALVASNAAFTAPENYNGEWIIGNEPTHQPFTGDIGQVSVYTTALNQLQVQTLATYSGFYTATLAAIGVGTTAPAANLDVEGTGLFKNGVNSTTSFQVQNATGTPLLIADTTDMHVTVADLVDVGDLTVNGHIITGGTAITVFSSGVGSCSGGGSVGVTGDDTSGLVSITAGTAPCSLAGTLINVQFASPYASTPHVVITPAEPNGSTLQYYVTASPSGFVVKTNTANLVGGQQYNYNYIVVQ